MVIAKGTMVCIMINAEDRGPRVVKGASIIAVTMHKYHVASATIPIVQEGRMERLVVICDWMYKYIGINNIILAQLTFPQSTLIRFRRLIVASC